MMDDMNGERNRVRPDVKEPAQPSGPADADEDIFGDAGRNIVMEDANGPSAKNRLQGLLRCWTVPGQAHRLLVLEEEPRKEL